MRDQRFVRFQLGEEQRQQTIEHAQIVAQEIWFPDTVNVLGTWTVAAARHMPEPTPESFVIEPDDDLRASLMRVEVLPPDLVDRFIRWRPWGWSEHADPEVAWVWGTAVADAALQLGALPSAVSYLWDYVAYEDVSRQAFYRRLTAALTSGQGAELLSFIRAIPTAVQDLTGCDLRREAPDVVARITRWWTLATIHHCWDDSTRDVFPAYCHDAGLLRLLHDCDKRDYLDALERTRNPVVVAALFTNPEIHDDRDEILSLLTIAPAAWMPRTTDASAGTWTGGLTAPLLLATLIEHVDKLNHLITVNGRASEVADERDALFNVDLPLLCDRLVETLTARDDGLFLTTQFLAHLMHRLELLQSRDGVPAIVHLCDGFAKSMAGHGLTLADFARVHDDSLDWPADLFTADVERAPVPARLPAIHRADIVLAALAVCGYNRDTEAITHLVPLLSKLLLDRDPGLIAARHPIPSFRHSYAAYIILFAFDPIERWAVLWGALAEQRLRSLYRTFTHDAAAEESSVFVVNAGIAALPSLWADTDKTGDADCRLWDVLFNAVLGVVIRQQRIDTTDHWRVAAARLVAATPRISGQESNIALSSHALHQLGLDDDLLIECAACLSLNGLGALDVVKAFADADVSLASVADRWDQLEDTSTRRPINAPETARDIVRRILSEVGQVKLSSSSTP